MNNTNYPSPTVENIASLENLYMAWNRLAQSITYSDVWYDEYDFQRFECMLDHNIRSIRESLRKGSYKMDPIRPIPFPKGGKDDNGNLKVRPAFWITLKDQLVWVAICNILGPHIEIMIPGWSTGNRLYVPMWKEQNENNEKWQYGSFLNSYPFIYRKWKQGWPRYRKVLTAAIKRMAIGKSGKDEEDILDETDEAEIAENNGLPLWLGIRYLSDNYFGGKHFKRELYWGGIDLKTFYPTIDTNLLVKDLIKYAQIQDESVKQLIQTMFDLEINKSGFSEEELRDMGIENEKRIGLPTGLIVGGWLANVYMLDIDKVIDEKLSQNKNIIHFRYVDDHTFVAKTFEDLIDWMNEYWILLKKRNLKINFDKIQPPLPLPYSKILAGLIEHGKSYIIDDEIKRQLESDDEDPLIKIKQICTIDPIYPSPLMTLTLQKVSQISHLSLNLLSKNENDLVFHDLKSLITVDLPDAEIKKETRISFASTMLSRMLISNSLDLDRIRDLRELFISSCVSARESIKSTVGINNNKVSILSESDKLNNAIDKNIKKKILINACHMHLMIGNLLQRKILKSFFLQLIGKL